MTIADSPYPDDVRAAGLALWDALEARMADRVVMDVEQFDYTNNTITVMSRSRTARVSVELLLEYSPDVLAGKILDEFAKAEAVA